MFVKTQAVVISNVKYRDSDLIVKCYTKALGSVTFMVKGVLKSKKGKFRASMFQPLSLIDIEMQYRNKSHLEYFKEVQLSHHLNELQSNVYKSSLVMFLSEILKSVIVEEEQNVKLYKFINESVLYLENTTKYANFHIAFILKLSSFLGFYPHLSTHKDEIYFNLSEGLFQNFESPYTLNLGLSNLFSEFIRNDFNNNQHLQLSKKQRSDILKLLINYYELHIENFKSPKSLEVIEQIFS
ncbi:DNA repair protein RecO [Flavobacterium sp. CS20]|uniref:DNA repair protein RecO n=1 Tax=Flavobacterium sp. CS20 TaxID=2775246 RepID=UPI001B3A4923|nr:DNA repair protein RecO [Flavobacterium sp. CS20]QTY26796.1 DNA repair protein RecO [Flavobacterium sp. CS20]